MKPADSKWRRRPLVEKITKAVSGAVSPAKKPRRQLDRATRIDEQGRRVVLWPDDDLRELEADDRPGWINRRKAREWLRR
jgi:hypothetical protein